MELDIDIQGTNENIKTHVTALISSQPTRLSINRTKKDISLRSRRKTNKQKKNRKTKKKNQNKQRTPEKIPL